MLLDYRDDGDKMDDVRHITCYRCFTLMCRRPADADSYVELNLVALWAPLWSQHVWVR